MVHIALSLAAIGAIICLAGALPAAAQDAAPANTATPRNTPGLPAELQAIDDVLTGGLLNDPTDMNWVTYGNQLGSQVVLDESYPGGGAAMRITMGAAGEIYAGGLNVPLLSRIQRGERITIGFFARTLESDAPDGKGRVGVRFQQNREPYPGFGDTTVAVDDEWGFYEVTAVADQTIGSDAIVALQFGLARQTVEIGQAIVVSGTRSVTD